MSWRDSAVRIIWATVEKAQREGVSDPKQILALVSDAYPWGPRDHHPYKVWLAEVRKLKQRLGVPSRAKPPADPGPHGELFGRGDT